MPRTIVARVKPEIYTIFVRSMEGNLSSEGRSGLRADINLP